MWRYFYKIDQYDRTYCPANIIYSPYISPDDSTYCMSWDHEDPYQFSTYRTAYTKDTVDFFYKREREFLEMFKDKPWAPEILEIDDAQKKIFYKWGKSCNHLIYSGEQDLNELCPTWKEQLSAIITDVYDAGYYKMSMYPHCCYLDESNNLRTMDFYACVSRAHPLIEKTVLQGLIGLDEANRFGTASAGDYIDFTVFFKEAMLYHIKWPDNPLPGLYRKLTGL